MELAAELLDVRNEQELDHFLGDLISKVGKGISGFANSAAGKVVGGALKQVAKAALPIAGTALGTFVVGPVGGMLGGKLASAAGDMFGLELEGLSGEDREFETVRRFVRFAGSAVNHAKRSPRPANPRQVAHTAILNAAQQYAPGLFQRMGGRRPAQPRSVAGMPPAPPHSRPAPPRPVAGMPVGYAPADGDGYGLDVAFDDAAPADDQGFDWPDVADVAGYGDPGGIVPASARRRGTWIRRGRRIILFGA